MFIQENLLTAQAEIQVEGSRENPTSALVISMVLNMIKISFRHLTKVSINMFIATHPCTRFDSNSHTSPQSKYHSLIYNIWQSIFW